MTSLNASLQAQLAIQVKRTLRQCSIDLQLLQDKWNSVNIASTPFVNTAASYLIELEYASSTSNWLPSALAIPNIQHAHRVKIIDSLKRDAIEKLDEYMSQFVKIVTNMNKLSSAVSESISNERLDVSYRVLSVLSFDRFYSMFTQITNMYNSELKLKQALLRDITAAATSQPQSRDKSNKKDDDGSMAMNMITIRSSAWLYQPYLDEGVVGDVTEVAESLEAWTIAVKKEKAIYYAMTMFKYDVNRKALIAEGWAPSANLTSIQYVLRTAMAPQSHLHSTSYAPQRHRRNNILNNMLRHPETEMATIIGINILVEAAAAQGVRNVPKRSKLHRAISQKPSQ
ncbi:hypothetical protein SmJEL517_g03984 [Synchytrium microbalum]|uniref:V-type proton ATPase subunit a n=1 Tax=Synchytrium microbalum TaxID=1806994 RepID=A0A507C4F4_9FUNG|nr:uncharacterized protein SmJEL517_g03984 [Synchytrium microbalum]TPX33004.1 hypothetical protein SmJEL517_g03984 [Synchytrium microbalum]